MTRSRSLETVVLNPLERGDWNDRIRTFSESTIFHSANWARLLADVYGFHPSYVASFEEGVLKGCLPVVEVHNRPMGRRGVSVSFADSCGSLLAHGAEFAPLMERAFSYGKERGWRSVEFRGELLLAGETASESYLHHVVELAEDEGVMLARLRESNVRNIRKAVREGVRVEFSTSLESVSEFYRLHCLTRKRHGIPPQPKRFFVKLHEHLLSQGSGFTALATYRGQAVAGTICLAFGTNALYKYGASDETFQEVRANNLVLWESMRHCAGKGYRFFSLGRTEPENRGLLVFKNGWGASPTPMHYHRYDLAEDRFTVGSHRELKLVRTVLRRMPAGVLRGIGALLYRYAG